MRHRILAVLVALAAVFAVAPATATPSPGADRQPAHSVSATATP